MSDDQKLLFTWSQYENAKSRAEELCEEHPEDYPDADAAFDDACGDEDADRFEWECLMDRMKEWLEEHEYEVFYVEADGLGWRNLSGHARFTINPGDAATFISKVIGVGTSCAFKFFGGQGGAILQGTVWHHDSPTGEARRVYLASTCDLCGEIIMPGETHCAPDGAFCGDCIKLEMEV